MNSIFNTSFIDAQIGQLSLETKLIFWIKSIDSDEQIYISPSFSSLWALTVNQLYNDPTIWKRSLQNDDLDMINPQLQRRCRQTVDFIDKQVIFYRFKSFDKKIYHMCNLAFPIRNQVNYPLAMAGVSQELPLDVWENYRSENISDDPKLPFLSSIPPLFYNTIINSNPSHKIKDNILSILSPREYECLYYSCKGLTAKMIAKHLKISPRTAEVHLENCRKKLNCSNKLELIGLFTMLQQPSPLVEVMD